MYMIEHVYSDIERGKKLNKQIRKIYKYKPAINLFLVTFPIADKGILEIYNYNVLLQPYYRQHEEEIIIVGISSKKDEAEELIRSIVEETVRETGGLNVKEYIDSKYSVIKLPPKRKSARKRIRDITDISMKDAQ
ncbi:MAG TPA: hypothetical protein DEO87_04545 [Lachnospiraceae bacterium]|nr:hypothetical protein [Lachnospiraceae bacterium]